METQTREKIPNGQLFVVATPIGSLDDMTFRAVNTLKSVAKIAAEDTRNSKVLLRHFAITTPMIACHEHNEKQVAEHIVALLSEGLDVALISDAGTPLINDPGFRLLQIIIASGARVVPLPGACSPIVALSAAGLPSDRFTYLGFFPRGGSAKTEVLRFIEQNRHTLMFLESPRRIEKTLQLLAAPCAGRELCIGRELTKLHEEFLRGSCEELLAHFLQHPPRGEMVLLIGPSNSPVVVDDATIIRAASMAEFAELAPSARARAIAKSFDVSRSRVYKLLNDLD